MSDVRTRIPRRSGCERIVELLADRRWHTTYEIQVGLGVMCHSRVADLRKRGYLIERRTTGGEGLNANEYRLVAAPGETTDSVHSPVVPVVSPDADQAAVALGGKHQAASDFEQLVLA